MNPKYVTSLALSKKLKDCGAPQESEWYWRVVEVISPIKETEITLIKANVEYETENIKVKAYPAFHVGELGEMLIQAAEKMKGIIVREHRERIGQLIRRLEVFPPSEQEAEDRGKMLLYLLENNLIPKGKV